MAKAGEGTTMSPEKVATNGPEIEVMQNGEGPTKGACEGLTVPTVSVTPPTPEILKDSCNDSQPEDAGKKKRHPRAQTSRIRAILPGLPVKMSIRLEMWSRLEYENLVLFPRPCWRRIPRFKGENEAIERLAQLDVFKDAKIVKLCLDKAHEKIRQRMLESGKEFVVGSPGLREAVFLVVNPPMNPCPDNIIKAATRLGIHLMGTALDFKAKQVNLVIVGSVAVDKKGRHIGKGEGFSDLEYALLNKLGTIPSDTVIATIVHDLQVCDELPESVFEPHDVPVDLIITPTRVIEVKKKLTRPTLLWDCLTEERVNQIPIIKQLLDKEITSGTQIKLKKDDPHRNPFKRQKLPERSLGWLGQRSSAQNGKTRRRTMNSSDSSKSVQRSGVRRQQKPRLRADYSIKIGGLPKSVKVNNLKAALGERGVYPVDISLLAARGIAYLHFLKQRKINEVPQPETNVDDTVALLQGLSVQEEDGYMAYLNVEVAPILEPKREATTKEEFSNGSNPVDNQRSTSMQKPTRSRKHSGGKKPSGRSISTDAQKATTEPSGSDSSNPAHTEETASRSKTRDKQKVSGGKKHTDNQTKVDQNSDSAPKTTNDQEHGDGTIHSEDQKPALQQTSDNCPEPNQATCESKTTNEATFIIDHKSINGSKLTSLTNDVPKPTNGQKPKEDQKHANQPVCTNGQKSDNCTERATGINLTNGQKLADKPVKPACAPTPPQNNNLSSSPKPIEDKKPATGPKTTEEPKPAGELGKPAGATTPPQNNKPISGPKPIEVKKPATGSKTADELVKPAGAPTPPQNNKPTTGSKPIEVKKSVTGSKTTEEPTLANNQKSENGSKLTSVTNNVPITTDTQKPNKNSQSELVKPGAPNQPMNKPTIGPKPITVQKRGTGPKTIEEPNPADDQKPVNCSKPLIGSKPNEGQKTSTGTKLADDLNTTHLSKSPSGLKATEGQKPAIGPDCVNKKPTDCSTPVVGPKTTKETGSNLKSC